MFSDRNFIIFFIISFVSLISNAQEIAKELDGKIESETMEVSDVHVINANSKKATITNAYGYFRISVKLNDTIWFSAIQYEKSQLIVTNEILQSKMVTVRLKESLTELDEVVITPYKLSGDIAKDIQSLKIEPVVTSSTLGLPNAHVKQLSLNERKLFLAMEEQALHRLIDEITGHNRRLRKMVSLDEVAEQIEIIKKFYAVSLYSQKLKVPEERIDDFMYFCAFDTIFKATVDGQDKLKIWEFLEDRSKIYRVNNDLE
ncbi:hypothetical protein FEE95_19115 [Maribacter algarum]|uniref:CarboxypepD_reg-like domain-containing protein n=1 Tax=Maribacter algarum (ex Zhang et al. 2020) TaxID=2578118 RepID=A0A5S3PGD6_9FLAO|nr:carboxypeptidase-like regulatory domain-containing protein [Maribacter algarum]TMM53182.1 hypothetical protein FEE95_19115 [Maribacter algarum]